MLLDLGHQQDFALLLLSYLKGIVTGDALTLRMNGQGQGQSIQRRHMKYRLQDEFDKIYRCVIVVIKDDVPHARTFCLYLVLFEEIDFRFIEGFKWVWILFLRERAAEYFCHLIPIHPLFAI